MDTNNEYNWQHFYRQLALQHEEFGQNYQFIIQMGINRTRRNPIFVEVCEEKGDLILITFCDLGLQESENPNWTRAAIIRDDLLYYINNSGDTINSEWKVENDEIVEKTYHTEAEFLLFNHLERYATVYIEEGYEIIQL
jgi:hypothetical protein